MNDRTTSGPTGPSEPQNRKGKHARHGSAYFVEKAPEDADWGEITAAIENGELPDGWSE